MHTHHSVKRIPLADCPAYFFFLLFGKEHPSESLGALLFIVIAFMDLFL